jgi:dTMP kinase
VVSSATGRKNRIDRPLGRDHARTRRHDAGRKPARLVAQSADGPRNRGAADVRRAPGHLAQIIEPALARGDWVLSDRFSDATFAYQGGGRGLPRDKLEALERWVQGGFQPDLTVLFDVPTNVASERRGAVRSPDKFESESDSFFGRTRAEYLRRAAESPERFVIIDATQSITDIQKQLDKMIANI